MRFCSNMGVPGCSVRRFWIYSLPCTLATMAESPEMDPSKESIRLSSIWLSVRYMRCLISFFVLV